MIRFKVQQGDSATLTPWIEEVVKHGAGPQTAVVEVGKLRQQYPDAAISIERATVIPKPERQMFRYDIFVRDGFIKVIDEDGEHIVHVANTTVQSRPFQEAEREAVITELKEKFPDAQLTEVRL
jgi:hypothetical protein